MIEKPILFSAPMVRAILAGAKTQTRRAIKWGSQGADDPSIVRCPYGARGDRLWVRETFARDVPGCGAQGGLSYRADHDDPRGDGPASPMKWTPSIFMRRAESRILLEITGVRVERVQSITETDAFAEGVLPLSPPTTLVDPVVRFARLWWEINGKDSWEANPWVWVLSFVRLNTHTHTCPLCGTVEKCIGPHVSTQKLPCVACRKMLVDMHATLEPLRREILDAIGPQQAPEATLPGMGVRDVG